MSLVVSFIHSPSDAPRTQRSGERTVRHESSRALCSHRTQTSPPTSPTAALSVCPLRKVVRCAPSRLWSCIGNTTPRPIVLPFIYDCYLRFCVVRTETCRALLRRAHRHLLNSAILVSLMGHTAVQTSVAEGFLAMEATTHGSVSLGGLGIRCCLLV